MAEEESRQIFDPVTRTFDGRKLRVTDLPFNPRVTLPRGIPEEEEASLEIRRKKHLELVREYIKEKCNEDGEQVQNLSKGAQRGIKSLKKRIREGELVVLETDKSNRFCVTTIDNYRSMGEVHTKNDRKITREEMIENEKTINSHAAMMRKMFNFGQSHEQEDRVHAAVTNKDQNTATLSLLYKDHKQEPGKTRPLVSGNTSNTQGLSTMGSFLFESAAQSIKKPLELNSTEDLGSVCMEVNKTIKARIDREIEEESKEESDTNADNTASSTVTGEDLPNSCDISRNDNVKHMERSEEEEEPTGKMQNDQRDEEKPATTTEPSNQKCERGGQQLMWRYIEKEKKLEKIQEDTSTKNLRTSNRVTSPETRNKIVVIGSDVVALFPSLTARETGEAKP